MIIKRSAQHNMRLDILLQIVVCIVHTAGSQDKHQEHPAQHKEQEGVLDGKLTSHVDNRFRKIENYGKSDHKGSHSYLESYPDESDKIGSSPFEVEESDESLVAQMKLLVQKLASKHEWKESYEIDANSDEPEGIAERVFEHSKDNPNIDISKRDSTLSQQENYEREMENTGKNENEVAGDAYSESVMTKNEINDQLFHYQIDGQCDKQDGSCSNKEDKTFSETSGKEVTPAEKYGKESQDRKSHKKNRETTLEKLDAMHKLERHDASFSTDKELFVDKAQISLIEQLKILEQKVKQQDDWKRMYSNAENLHDYEIAKESKKPVQSIFIVAEKTPKSLLGQMKELERKVQEQENQKHSDVSEHNLAKNELRMRDANGGESKESMDEKDLNPSPTAYFPKEGIDSVSEASYVMVNEDEKEKLIHSVVVEGHSSGSLIDQMKILEQKLKSNFDWKKEYGNHNNFEDVLKERNTEKFNELEGNLLLFKTSSYSKHKDVETLAEKYKMEYQNTYHEKLHFMEKRGGSLTDQMKKLEQKIKTKEGWNELHDKNSVHYENRKEESEIITTHASADVTSATGLKNINFSHKQDGVHYFQKEKRQKCFQTNEYSIPQIDTVERVIDQVIAYDQLEMNHAKQGKEISSLDIGEHMDDTGKSHSMHDQKINSIPQTEIPVFDVSPSKTAVINDTGQWISFLQTRRENLAESTVLKTFTKIEIERSAVMSNNIESSTTQIWFHSVPMKDNRLDNMANIGDNLQPQSKYQVKSKSQDVDVIYREKETGIVAYDEDNVGNSNTMIHGFPNNILNEDNPKILSTDNSKATQVKTFCHRPYGLSKTRTELNTLSKPDGDKNSMITDVDVNTKMPTCVGVYTTETIAGMHITQTNAELSTKQTIVKMNTLQTNTGLHTLQGVNNVQTNVDLNTRKAAKNSMQPSSKDNIVGRNIVQMVSHVTTLPEIDSSFSAQIHMQVEPSVNLWYTGTAGNERLSQHKEQIEQSTQNYAVKIPVIVLSSVVLDHMTSISDHLSHTSIERSSTLEISTSHELLWQPGEAKSWGNRYSYFVNDALYQSTSDSHQLIPSISHTRYSDRNTRIR